MCGIAGFVAQAASDDLSIMLRSMADVISHRGPDDEGFFEIKTKNHGYMSVRPPICLLFKIVCSNQGIEYDREIDKRPEKSCGYIYSLVDSKGKGLIAATTLIINL